MVCKGWRETTRKLWRAAEELRLRVPAKAQIGFFGSMLQKCPGLIKLSLTMESDVDATMLACIAFSCPNLQSLEIFTSGTSVNRITGDELSRFISEKRCLTSLKMEGCCNLGGLIFSSISLSTLWGIEVCGSNGYFNQAPILVGNADCLVTNAISGLISLRSKCFHDAVFLCRSSISDSGIGMICNVFPETLSKLLLALCPNITSSGIQFATAQLPCLEIMDCGMTICDPGPEISNKEDNDSDLQRTPNGKLHLIYQKLIIKHSRLKKLSLWGCSGLDALYLNCPQLFDLNLNSCRNLHPERSLLQCPNLESLHASGCQDMLVKAIQNQVKNQIRFENKM
ncbi:Hypothetical predicted protein [Olea europaea subsp. europaea]|uniref:Uncharacterized protein n=1 Tax=Olea europaea subsp. europaea TaxID=158383 RepID=A0A8S0UDS1_OLEEU|nr:Hypothetical predicted protein [Olea europaea subsp. europaea]